jgi:hypothetical protein
MPNTPYVTIVIVQDTEKDLDYLSYCLRGLWELNVDALSQCQVIVINQHPDDADVVEACRLHPLDVAVINAEHPVVDGIVIWNVQESLRNVRPLMRGRYMTLWHPEYIADIGAVGRMIGWLRKNNEPLLTRGNLRRLGQKVGRDFPVEQHRKVSQAFRQAMDKGALASFTPTVANVPWDHYAPAAQLRATYRRWREDVFYARLDWLDATRFLHHADRLCFEDVFGLMGQLYQCLTVAGLAPAAPAPPPEAARMWHLWHPKRYQHFTPEVRRYFFADPQRWHGTAFLNRELMDRLVDRDRGHPLTCQTFRNALRQLHVGPGGAFPRFSQAVKRWLLNGGGKAIKPFLPVT